MYMYIIHKVWLFSSLIRDLINTRSIISGQEMDDGKWSMKLKRSIFRVFDYQTLFIMLTKTLQDKIFINTVICLNPFSENRNWRLTKWNTFNTFFIKCLLVMNVSLEVSGIWRVQNLVLKGFETFEISHWK